MEGNGVIRAAIHAFFAFVVDVLPVPEVGGGVARDEVVLRHEREEASSAERVTGIAGFHLDGFKADADLDVFCAAVFRRAEGRIRDALLLKVKVRSDNISHMSFAYLNESPDRFFTKNITGSSAHIALLDVRLEATPKINRV